MLDQQNVYNSSVRNSQQGSDSREVKHNEGFVKSLRKVNRKIWGPDSPVPDKWRVFSFILERIQDNKRPCESERITREYICKNTGICESNFNRIISSLEKDKMLYVKRGNYRDSTATYSLDKDRFNFSVIVPDKKKEVPGKLGVVVRDNSEKGVDKSDSDVDKSDPKTEPNFKMKSGNESKLQNEVTELQNEVETVVTTAESLIDFSLRSLPVITPDASLISLEGNQGSENGESFTLPGIGAGSWLDRSQDIERASREKFKRQLASKEWQDIVAKERQAV